MKRGLIAVLFLGNACFAQKWQAEVLTGVTGYNGDLTQGHLSTHTMKPAVGVNIRYELGGNLVTRLGVLYGKVAGNDKYNPDFFLNSRNLSFQSSLLEGSFCFELNLFPSDLYDAYPYLFAGVGFFHFNPYAYDNDNNKVYLQPLGTEGQGLSEYPSKKMYSLTQFCVPFGGGWKWMFKDTWGIAVEVGYRLTFTDYLDDVSGTYADAETLMSKRGPKAAEMAYRQSTGNGIAGDIRGNPKVKDWYFFDGIKLTYKIGKKRQM